LELLVVPTGTQSKMYGRRHGRKLAWPIPSI
jgi:hypothetical protein